MTTFDTQVRAKYLVRVRRSLARFLPSLVCSELVPLAQGNATDTKTGQTIPDKRAREKFAEKCPWFPPLFTTEIWKRGGDGNLVHLFLSAAEEIFSVPGGGERVIPTSSFRRGERRGTLFTPLSVCLYRSSEPIRSLSLWYAKGPR